MSRYMLEGTTREEYRSQITAVSHARGEQLREYWRKVAEVASSAMSAVNRKCTLDALYRDAFHRSRLGK